MSLRLRLTLIICAATALLIVVDSLRRLRDAEQDSLAEIQSTTRIAMALLPDTLAPASEDATTEQTRPLRALELPPGLSDIRHLRVEIHDRAGGLISRSRAPTESASPFLLRLLGSRLHALPPVRKDIRAASVGIGYYLLIPDAQDELDEIWSDYLEHLMLMAAFVCVLAVLVYWAVGRALHPVKAVLQALRDIEAGRLNTRLPEFPLQELAPLSDSFNRMTRTLQTVVNERAVLMRKLVDSEEETRRSIARDLHDELSPYLVAMHPHARLLTDACEALPAMAEHRPSASLLVSHVGHLLRRVRNLLEHLRPPDLEALGLRQTLEELIRQWQRLAGPIRVNYTAEGDWQGFSPTLDIVVYRIVQECLTNVSKHSQCTAVSIAVNQHSDCIHVCVEDNGQPKPSVLPESGLGMLGMRERAIAMGGECLAGPSGRGWKVNVTLPLHANQEVEP